MKAQRILGIDPGYNKLGWGIVDYDSQDPHFIAAGCIQTPAKMPFPERLINIYKDLDKIIKKYQPQTCAIESLFFNKNTKTAIKVSQARGVILLIAQQKRLLIKEYTPLQIKQSLIGYGRGDKSQIIKILKFHLKVNDLPSQDDTCDAIAAAITCAYTNPQLSA